MSERRGGGLKKRGGEGRGGGGEGGGLYVSKEVGK